MSSSPMEPADVAPEQAAEESVPDDDAPTERLVLAPPAEPAPVRGLDGEQPFVPWTPEPAGGRELLDRIADPRGAERVRTVMLAGVAAEGPVHVDRLARLTAGAFGLTRVVRSRLDALAALVPPELRAGDVVWPAELDRGTWTGFRRDPDAERPMEQVAPEEIGNAMGALCRASAGMTRDELFAATLEVFGFRRRTAAQVAVLESVLAATTATGRLRETASGVVSG